MYVRILFATLQGETIDRHNSAADHQTKGRLHASE